MVIVKVVFVSILSMRQTDKRKALTTLASLALMALTLLAGAPSHALRVQLSSDLVIRTLANQRLQSGGVLKAGSIVEIPDDFTVLNQYGQADLTATLSNWIKATGYNDTSLPSAQDREGEQHDYFFPMTLISATPGSTFPNPKSRTTTYMAIRVLSASGAARVISDPNRRTVSAKSFDGEPLRSALRPAIAPRQQLEAATTCIDGSCTRTQDQISGTIAPLASALNSAAAQANPPSVSAPAAAQASAPATPPTILPPTTRRMNPRCANIMDTNGNLGAWGEAIKKVLSEEPYNRSFAANNALGSFCPKFNSLSRERRIQAQIWFWTALAQEESGCNPNKEHGQWYTDAQGVKRRLNPTTGWGLWAMEKSANLRRTRGPACYDIGSVEGQARCSIDIMQKVHYDNGRATSVSRGSYWGPIHRGSSQLMPHMRRFQECFQ